MDISIVKMMFYIQIMSQAINAEWIVSHTGLPPCTKTRPTTFQLTLTWSTEESPDVNNISLNLVRSEAVDRWIPVHTLDEQRRPKQASLASLKHSTFYHDLHTQASISLTSFAGEDFSLTGSFLWSNDQHNIQPFHPKLHKRSLGATKGSYIITKRTLTESAKYADSLVPTSKADRSTYDDAMKMYEVKYGQHNNGDDSANEQHGDSADHDRVKRQTLPATTYIVQIYMIVDYYLYTTLTASATRINWAGGADDYVAFVMSHQASEIDVRYRNIDSSIPPVNGNWTIGTKLSHLLIAKTTGDSPWTHPLDDPVTLEIDSSILLKNVTNWIDNAGLPADADHVMLVTSLDLTYGGNNANAGLAWVGGACGSSRTSVNQFGGTTVLSHELGHNLLAKHDGDGNGCSTDSGFVMTPSSGLTSEATRGNPWRFSNCSIEYFDTFFTTLNNGGKNCLSNAGDYVSTWADDSTEYIGKSIPADEQCKLYHGTKYTYYISKFSSICSALWCRYSGTITAKRSSMPYTTCGNKKWCVEEKCVSDVRAAALNEDCPFGEVKGDITGEVGTTCADINNINCWSSDLIKEECCLTCPKLATPWLGPNCTYGDRHTGCAGFADDPQTQCGGNEATCCQTCCEVAGPAVGYSCTAPTTAVLVTTTTTAPPTTTTPITTTAITTESPTTTTEPPTTTTTEPPTTTTTESPTTTTTEPPTITTTELPTTTITELQATATTKPQTTTITELQATATTEPQTTTITEPQTTTTAGSQDVIASTPSYSTTPAPQATHGKQPTTTDIESTIVTTEQTSQTSSTERVSTYAATTTAPSDTTAIATDPATTTDKTTTTAAAAANDRQKKGYHTRRFTAILTIDKIQGKKFICNDSALQDNSSSTYTEFQGIVCGSIKKYVERATCRVLQVACGSFIVGVAIAKEHRDNDSAAIAGRATATGIEQQLSAILNDADLKITKLPEVKDVNECADSSLSTCSSNAQCVNTDGYFTCSCSTEYSSDLSQYADELGRVCAKPCTAGHCFSDRTCEEQPDRDPICTCSGGVCDSWIYGLIAGTVLLGIITITIILCFVIRQKSGKAGRRRPMTRGIPYDNHAMVMDSDISRRHRISPKRYLSAVEEADYIS